MGRYLYWRESGGVAGGPGEWAGSTKEIMNCESGSVRTRGDTFHSAVAWWVLNYESCP